MKMIMEKHLMHYDFGFPSLKMISQYYFYPRSIYWFRYSVNIVFSVPRDFYQPIFLQSYFLSLVISPKVYWINQYFWFHF